MEFRNSEFTGRSDALVYDWTHKSVVLMLLDPGKFVIHKGVWTVGFLQFYVTTHSINDSPATKTCTIQALVETTLKLSDAPRRSIVG